ncbi:MAG: hypothetical protein Q8Q42_01700 [Nanoarchaeota archaeon]|nr:hypothetical protein [Nanoarchaeota archaeon]
MTADFSGYILPRGRTLAVVDNLIYDELGKEALEKLNSKFKGTQLAYSPNEMPQEGQPLRFSNIRSLFLEQAVGELTNNKITLLSPEQILANWNNIPERDETYADSSLAIYPNEGPNETHRKRALGIINISNPAAPIIVSGLTIAIADNEDVFTLEPTNHTAYKEAPWLEKTQMITYNPKTGEIEPSEDGIMVQVPNDQSGLRRLFRVRDGLDARYVRLLNADEDGRVQVIQDPKDHQKNLELILKREASEMQARLMGALEYLKTGSIPNK